MATLFRASVALAVTLGITACSGAGGSNTPVFGPGVGSGGGYTYQPCNIGASVTLANPQSGAYGVPTNTGTLEIVTYGNNNAISQNPGSWTLALQTYSGALTPFNGTLAVTSDPNGYHPYPSDFYYDQSVSGLQAGQQYTVYVEQIGYQYSGGNCASAIGSFST